MMIRTIQPNNLGWLEIKLDEVHLKHLWDCIKDPICNHKPKLAGAVSRSQLIKDKDDFFFKNVLYHACRRYEKDFNGLPVKSLPITGKHPMFLSSMWVNYQKQTEFNPRHDHTGIYSFVVWMKIPTNFKDQRQLEFAESNIDMISNFCFDYRNILGHEVGCIYEMSPEMEGTMLFFPSELHHEVYPFYKCDQERISISGNLMFDTRVCI